MSDAARAGLVRRQLVMYEDDGWEGFVDERLALVRARFDVIDLCLRGWPDAADVARGVLAGLLGRRELDVVRAPWASTANALIRASHFNEGVREGRRRLQVTSEGAGGRGEFFRKTCCRDDWRPDR